MNNKITSSGVPALAAAALLSCTYPIEHAEQQSRGGAAEIDSVTIMTFNVENLFDNRDDRVKDDKAYLPIEAKQSQAHVDECNRIEFESFRYECLYLDWNDGAVAHKLEVVAETIRQVGDGRGPDIVVMQEVENTGVLERLRTEYLARSGYLPPILIEGQDHRGIDVAFLSRLPLAGPADLHAIAFDDFPDRAGDTRGVLEATFVLPDGSLLTGFAVHFPAPYHPTEMRTVAYQHLVELQSRLPPGRNVFAAGDFNTTTAEDNRERMLERFVRPLWNIVHEQCEGCPGTSYYARDDSWSFLDMILYSPGRGADATWEIRPGSAQIANRNPAQVTDEGTPRRYDAGSREGVSDHWPLVAIIQPTEKQ
jgi:endonuclease/exonuclease/phosphatase family metal-dependent hydrolase